MDRTRKIAAVIIVLGMAVPAFAAEPIIEEPGRHLNQVETEIHAVLGSRSLGGGFRVGMPVLEQGFISTLNNNVVLNAGADLLSWPDPDYGVVGAIVPIMLQWNFYLLPQWSVFSEGGIAFQHWLSQRASGDTRTFFIWPDMSVGGRFYLRPDAYPALILRLGYPSGVTFGICF